MSAAGSSKKNHRQRSTEKILPKDAKKDAEAWEIIDGQQRLTTLYILYKYLITKCNISAESLKEDEIELYHLTYATRKGSSVFLANIGNNDDECNDNIDFSTCVKPMKLLTNG